MDFPASAQQIGERREAASSGEHVNSFQDGCLADAVFSGEQVYAAEAGNRQVVDASESLDGQVWKVKGTAHGVLHRRVRL